MNLTYTRPGELRKPDVEVLPDGRIRITRFIAAGHGDRDYSEVTTSVGTADNGLATALLVKRGMTRVEGKDALVLTYEVRNASTETPVGREDVQYGENGLKTVIADFVQMSSGTYTPQTVGTSTSTYDPTCVLRNEVMEDDGTTRQIRRFYINKGLINQVDEVRNNGALLIKTLVYLNDAPSPNPPSGYTLISTKVDNPGGLETTTYTFAKGDGQVGREDEIRNNAALSLATIRYLTTPAVTSNPITTPSGYVNIAYSYADQDGYRLWTASYAKGVGQVDKNQETRLSGMLLRTTLTYLTDPGVTTQPTTDPFGTGGTIVGNDVRDADGHRVWTVTWVKAVSTSNIIESTETRNGGKLIIYSRQMLGAAPSAPAATIGGVVTLISDRTELQDGYTLYSRTWAEGVGQISQDDETRNNGALLIRTIRYLTDGSVTSNPITTPTGYTNVSVSYAEQDGYKQWTASYAKGDGQISRDDEIKANGALLTATIRYITTPSVSSNPITTPTGYVNISYAFAEQEGHRVWTASYAKGNGQAGQEDEQRNNGRLAIRTIRYLSAPSVTSNPITTPGGYVLVSSGYADQEGHRVWTASYAAGSGQISQQDDTRNNGYLLLRTIRHLTDPSTSVSPISTPTGYSLISSSYEDASGYRVWTGSFAKGDGVINSGTELRNKGKLAIYKTTKLGSVPTTPTATIGGTVVLIDSNTRQQDGYTLYDYTWAEGYGTITSETDSRNQGKLKVYHIVSLGVDPSTPSATIGGTVVLIENATREESGVTIYDKRWAEGYGVIEKHLQMRDGGLRLETWVSIGGSYDASFMQPAGILMMKDNQESDGMTRWTVTCMQGATGGNPTSYSYSTEAWGKFSYPGRAKFYSVTMSIAGFGGNTFYAIDAFLSPPSTALVLQTTTISYQTSSSVGTLANPLWNPTEWATLYSALIDTTGTPRSQVQGLEGYSSMGGSTTSVTTGNVSTTSLLGHFVGLNTTATAWLSGGPTMPDGTTTYTLVAGVDKEPAFTAYDGTQYYRKVIVTATPAALPALPV